MPAKGWKKNKQQQEESIVKAIVIPEVPIKVNSSKQIEIITTESPKPDPPIVHPIKDDRAFAKVIVVYKNAKGAEKTTQYVVNNLTVREEVDEKYSETGRKQVHIHMSLDCDVMEKN